MVMWLHRWDWLGVVVMSHISKLLLSFEPRLRQRKWRHFKRSQMRKLLLLLDPRRGRTKGLSAMNSWDLPWVLLRDGSVFGFEL